MSCPYELHTIIVKGFRIGSLFFFAFKRALFERPNGNFRLRKCPQHRIPLCKSRRIDVAPRAIGAYLLDLRIDNIIPALPEFVRVFVENTLPKILINAEAESIQKWLLCQTKNLRTNMPACAWNTRTFTCYKQES